VSLILRSFGRTDIGRHRKANQDAFLCDDAMGLYVVADGMGGHAAGEVASSEAVDALFGFVKRGLADVGAEASADTRVRAACRIVEGGIQFATYIVFAISEIDRDKSGMGTTISAALAIGDTLIVGQVGDSRVYQIRGDEAVQITEDHTLIAWQLKQGIIDEQQARTSPHKNVITRAVGNRDYVQVDTLVVPMNPGDRYLLCSDGLHGNLRTAEIPELVAIGGDAAVAAFIDLANQRGGRDNITAVLVEVA
jgi:protein phosphatase